MKILVLNGSPKRDKSDTMHITRAFLNGMKEAAPQDIHIIHTIDQHIESCTGCFSCMRNGGSCIHNDDMKAILEEILNSDLLIWSFPLYCYGMPAPLKALLDRTLPQQHGHAEGRRPVRARRTGRLLAPALPDDLRLWLPQQQAEL